LGELGRGWVVAEVALPGWEFDVLRFDVLVVEADQEVVDAVEPGAALVVGGDDVPGPSFMSVCANM